MAVQLVKIACARPDERGRSLSTWFCADLAAKLARFIAEGNEQAHPCNWTTKSVAKVMAGAPAVAA